MQYDFLVIGAGISGTAAAFELSRHGRTVLIEAEAHAGYHSTGRSAALYTPNYGPETVRRIAKLSHRFLAEPPEGFAAQPLLKSRGMLTVVGVGCDDKAARVPAPDSDEFELLDAHDTLALAPFLRAERVQRGIYEKAVFDIDVDALLQGFLRGARQHGTDIITGCGVTGIAHCSEGWKVRAGGRMFKASTVINAAGAWADQLGVLAHATRIGLVPRRRTAILIDAPANLRLDSLPALDFAGTDNYIKPDAGQLMVSPGDAVAVDPQDIQPDELDVAVLVDWLERETTIEVRRPNHSWAGLRSFVDDGLPVVGFDPVVPDFFWLAGQGGYGIMLSAALGRATAALIVENSLPQDFIDAALDAGSLSPGRLLAR